MPADDFAILVGISQYADASYPKLQGPPHDVALMQTWLTSPDGGDVPPTRIKTIVSPAAFPADQDPLLAPPLAAQFDAIFITMERERLKLKGERLRNRLYLFFSGHGFSSRDIDRGEEAALYAANAAKDYYQHIYGTYFAKRAVRKALFKEVVLIMDCCRDAEATRTPIVPTLSNTPDDDLGAESLLLSIYAVPRGGKAHERTIAERNGTVHGLLTHALIKAFEESRPDKDGQISATRLRDHVRQTWNAIGGDDAPPAPQIFLPASEMYFTAKNSGVAVNFKFAAAQAADAALVLRDSQLKSFARLSASGVAADDVVNADSPIIKLERAGTSIRLRMLPGFYGYELTGAGAKKDTLKVESGEVNVDL